MSIWLRKRLLLWGSASMLVAVLWSNGSVLYAQDDEWRGHWISPDTKLTRDEAANKFVNMLDGMSGRRPGYAMLLRNEGVMEGVSAKSRRELKDENLHVVLLQLVSDWAGPRNKIRVESEGNKTATVVVEEDKTPVSRPLVLIEEDGSWGVDLLETYAKWHSLEGATKAEAIYKMTGIELPDLPVTEEFVRARENARRSACQSNLRQIGLGIAQYVQDYDEKMPLAKSWADSIMPYVKSEALFNCPAIPKGQHYGYAYNSKLSKKDLFVFQSPATIVSIYETSVLKRNAYGIGENSAFRHADGAIFGYLDGHVKWHAKGRTPSFNLGPVASVASANFPPPY